VKVAWSREDDIQLNLLFDKHFNASSYSSSTPARLEPAWYLVASSDRAIQPELRRRMASRIGAKTVDVKASHVPMPARPKDTADLLADTAS
jgi:hypothetical protein